MGQDHSFVSISVMPVDARIASDGGVEYSEAPERQLDHSPEQVCQLCWKRMIPEVISAPCNGVTVPNDLSSLEI